MSEFEIDCEKGFEYVVIYAWYIENDLAMDKNLFPTHKTQFKLPNPKLIPTF